MKPTTRIAHSRTAVAITAVIVTAVVVAGSLAAALPGANRVDRNDIQRNAVDSREIRNGTVQSVDIRNGTIRGIDVGFDTLTGAEIDESTLGTVPSAGSVNGATIALINHRSGNTGPTPILTLNGLTLLVSCTGGEETITAQTSTSGGSEISATSLDASATGGAFFGAFDDNFVPGDTFTAGPGGGNSSSDRQYTVTFSAADGRNVTATFITEDSVGGSNCAVSGHALG